MLLLTLTILIRDPTVNVFNADAYDTFGKYAVSLIAIDVVVKEKSSPLSSEK